MTRQTSPTYRSTAKLVVFSSENREKTLRFVLTFHGQATDKLPTGYRHITNSRPIFQAKPVGRLTVGRLSTDCRLTDGQLSADCPPTVGQQVFWGALLHNYPLTEHMGSTGKYRSKVVAVWTEG